MHKAPFKFRFITGAFNSILTPLSQKLQLILKYLVRHFKNYRKQTSERNGSNYVFSILNSKPVLHNLKLVERKNKEISCRDFTSLSTNLPHDKPRESHKNLLQKLWTPSHQN